MTLITHFDTIRERDWQQDRHRTTAKYASAVPEFFYGGGQRLEVRGGVHIQRKRAEKIVKISRHEDKNKQMDRRPGFLYIHLFHHSW